MKEHFDAELYYIGNKNHIEERIAKANGITFYGISSQGLEGENLFQKYVKFGLKNIKGTFQARKLLQEIKPDYVLGTGGFVSAPTLAAANILKIPYGIHEQNSIMGKVNKLFTNNAKTTFHTFPALENKNVFYSGIPIRFKQSLESNGEKLIFLGGSGGSIALNTFAVEFAKENPTIPIILQAGEQNYERAKLSGIPSNLEMIPFAENMLELYKEAKLIVARSGAGTIFEIANLGIPSILIPLPDSADDHQKKNAAFFTEEGAAKMVEQKDHFKEDLSKAIVHLWESEEKRLSMRKSLNNLAVRESDKIISERILKDIGKKVYN